MERLPWPTLHSGLTPADIPIDYSAYTSVLDDGRGYAPVVVGSETDDHGREVILVALSPGVYQAFTLVSAGAVGEAAAEALVRALGHLRDAVGPTAPPGTGAPSGGPASKISEREEAQ